MHRAKAGLLWAGLGLLALVLSACQLPLYPVPSTIWSPPGGYATGKNHAHLEVVSAPAPDQPSSLDNDQTNSLMYVSGGTDGIGVTIEGDHRWSVGVRAGPTPTTVKPGLYIPAYEFGHDPTSPTVDVTTQTAYTCTTSVGWFAVDAISWDAKGKLTALDMRFDRTCQGSPGEVRGDVHWRIGDTTQPPGPKKAPVGLWRAPADQVPSDRNYVYVHNDVTTGTLSDQTYTQANSAISVYQDDYADRPGVTVHLENDRSVYLRMKTRTGQPRLTTGWYQDPGFDNPARPSITAVEYQDCGAPSWVAIDSLAYATDGSMSALDLREQLSCDRGTSVRNVQVHWRAGDPTEPPLPAPIPATLWSAPTQAVPTTGNYVYLASDPGDWVGGGATWTYFGPGAKIQGFGSLHEAGVTLDDGFNWFTGQIEATVPASRPLTVGFYDGARRWPFQNPARPGMDWSGDGRGCDTQTGWFAVDDIGVAADGVTLTRLAYRFEQHCEGAGPALRGQVRWSAP